MVLDDWLVEAFTKGMNVKSSIASFKLKKA